MNFGLKQRDINYILHALTQIPEIEETLIFGSRAKGNYKKGSDVDLVIKGRGITRKDVRHLHFLLNESLPLPYFFDVVHYETLQSQELIEHIDRVGKILYTGVAEIVIYQNLRQSLITGKLVAVATVIAGPGLGRKLLFYPTGERFGSLGSLDDWIQHQANQLMSQQQSGRISCSLADEAIELFVDVYPPRAKLIMVGAVHIAIPLTTFAKSLGFYTTVVDARSLFATRERFPHVDELVIKWPSEFLSETEIDEATYIVTLSHDEKLDNPALEVAVNSKARYIGALGSRKTHAERIKALKDKGITDEVLSRIHAPIGLNIGAVGPEEIAVSIIAEIVAVRRDSLR